jgi:hypothetical protein
MSYYEFDFEDTHTMRAAVDIVAATLGDTFDKRRSEVARLILRLANEGGDYSAATLASVALEKMGFSHVVRDNGEQEAG